MSGHAFTDIFHGQRPAGVSGGTIPDGPSPALPPCGGGNPLQTLLRLENF